jgi:hypothetical protein
MKIAESFGRSGFAWFINSPAGRITRLVAGIALIIWGFIQLNSVFGFVFVVIGLIPFTAGAFDLCLVSALLGGPISGTHVRALKP